MGGLVYYFLRSEYEVGTSWVVPITLLDSCSLRIDGIVDSMPCKGLFKSVGAYHPFPELRGPISYSEWFEGDSVTLWILPDKSMIAGQKPHCYIDMEVDLDSRRIESVRAVSNVWADSLGQLRFSPMALYTAIVDSLKALVGNKVTRYDINSVNLQTIATELGYVNIRHVWDIGDSGRVEASLVWTSHYTGKGKMPEHSIKYEIEFMSKYYATLIPLPEKNDSD